MNIVRIPYAESWTSRVDSSYDKMEIHAWAAKAWGILSLAKKSLHFELPADYVLEKRSAREAYVRILSDLLTDTESFFLHGDQKAGTRTANEKTN